MEQWAIAREACRRHVCGATPKWAGAGAHRLGVCCRCRLRHEALWDEDLAVEGTLTLDVEGTEAVRCGLTALVDDAACGLRFRHRLDAIGVWACDTP